MVLWIFWLFKEMNFRNRNTKNSIFVTFPIFCILTECLTFLIICVILENFYALQFALLNIHLTQKHKLFKNMILLYSQAVPNLSVVIIKCTAFSFSGKIFSQ